MEKLLKEIKNGIKKYEEREKKWEYPKGVGWFYGFKSDIWASYAVGITYIDKIKG